MTIAKHVADPTTEDDRYTPSIETYTDEEWRATVTWMPAFADRCGQEHPGEHDTMSGACTRSVWLEATFRGVAYTQAGWVV